MPEEMKKSISTIEAYPKPLVKAIQIILSPKSQHIKTINLLLPIHPPWLINLYLQSLQLTHLHMISEGELPLLCVLSILKMSFHIFVFLAISPFALNAQFMDHTDNMKFRQLVGRFPQLSKDWIKRIKTLLCKSVT